MKNRISRLEELKSNPDIVNTMNWNWKEGWTYEDFWRNFLNQPLWNDRWRVISMQDNISELWWWVTSSQIWLSPPMQVANILEAETASWALDYTWSRWPDLVMKMYSSMLNSKIGKNVFWPFDLMRTWGWTEAISLLNKLFDRQKIIQCWPWYFMQYWNWNNIETLFNDEVWAEEGGTFKTLPDLKNIESSLWKWEILWIIEPWISGEGYSIEEWKEIFIIAKEKNAFVVIDLAFDWTQIKWKNSTNFYEIAEKNGMLDKTIFFGSPSKWQGYPWKRIWYLATKNKCILNNLIKSAWINRDGLALNIETNAMYTFLEIFDKEREDNPDIPINESIKNVFNNCCVNIFASIKDEVTPELMKKYVEWKKKYFNISSLSLSKFRDNTWKWKLFSWMWWEVKSLFNILLKIPPELSKNLFKKYDINEIVRYMFLYNWVLIAPGQNFGWDEKFWKNKPLIFRWTLTQDPTFAISQTKEAIEYLLNNNIK